MDINTLRIAVTLVSLAGFLGIVVWAYWPGHRRDMEQKGRSILEDNGS